MTAWPEWIDTGDKYLRSATGGGGKPPRFAGSLRYNLVAMAFESYAMAILDFKRLLPENHSITDLVLALQKCVFLDPDLIRGLLDYEKYQRICSFEDYERIEIGVDELDGFCEIVGKIAALAHMVTANDANFA
jgi:hypothetical protein